jgi:hypothetical protein
VRAAEICGGVAASHRVKSTGGPLPTPPSLQQEVALVRSFDQTLLRYDGVTVAIEGATPRDTTLLVDVVTSGSPVVAYVAQSSASELVLETRRFSQEIRIAEPMQFGIDDKVMDDLRRQHRVGGTVLDVSGWLADRLLLLAAPGEPREMRRMVVSGDARGRLDAFRIHGHKVAADIKRVDGRLRIERVVNGGNASKPRLTLLCAQTAIVDATLAAELHGSARTTLAQAVSGSSSYLRTWQDYQKLEREAVHRRRRTFGALEYQRAEQRRDDGGWRFHLAPLDDLLARLMTLGEADRFELEAGDRMPAFDDEKPESSAPGTRARRKHDRPLSAPILDVNVSGRFIDLSASDDEEEQPRPPNSGYLFLSIAGDETRLNRREGAEEALRTGRCPMPQLGLLMEGKPAPMARRRRVSLDGPTLKPVISEVFGRSRPTQRQREAIEYSLNTPDVCLIQGPPGTGKTKVITAIQRCLAVLADEGAEPSHRILVCAAQHDAVENVAQRTEVFGLPAMKVGRRRRSADSDFDPAQAFIDDRTERIGARVLVPPEAERLSLARNIVLSCVRTRSIPTELAGRVREIVRVLDELLPPPLRDRALERAARLERPTGAGAPEESEMLLRAARGIRVESAPFSDDGPLKARIALTRLDGILTPEERAFLRRCADAEEGTTPPWLTEGVPLRDALIDKLSLPSSPAEPQMDEETQRLLLEMLRTVDARIAAGRTGADAAVSSYLNDLISDPDAVRDALQHYTVVLASTLQHAASTQMRRIRGIDEGQTTFESVIVDEAARANPLDLFIPLSMAKRRVVLVGDHRQLPHLLEPDVERELAEGVEQGTVERQTLDAIQASLFERMWVLLRALQDSDTIERTVTLNAQYRMHPVLGAYVSRNFYEIHGDGCIESPRDAAEFVHDLPGYVKDGLPRAAAWLDVPGHHPADRERRGRSKSRPAEARAIAREMRRLIAHDERLTFGVIAFYGAQVDEIGLAMMEVGLTERANSTRGWRVADRWATTINHDGKTVERLRIGTVDAFQGKEFDVVLLSVTRSNELPGRTDEERRKKYGHLMLENRLCVAMSRQQRLLVAVGDLKFVREDDAREPLRALRAFTDLCRGDHGVIR